MSKEVVETSNYAGAVSSRKFPKVYPVECVFLVEFHFDLKQFDPEKLTQDLVMRVLELKKVHSPETGVTARIVQSWEENP